MTADITWTVIAGSNMETNVPVYGFPLQLGTAHYVNNLIMDTVGGVATNIAVGIRRLGFSTQVVSVVGQDFMGTEVLWELSGYGVNTRHIRTDWELTPRTIILVAPDGERQQLCDFRDSSTYRYPEEELREALSGAGRWVYTSTHDWVRYAALSARQMGKFVATDVHDVVDIDVYHHDFYRAANLIFVSMARLRPSLAEYAWRLYSEFEVDTVVAMDGPRGAWLVDGSSGTQVHVPAEPVPQVIDTVGAGDALAAGFCSALSAGLDLETCLQIGSRVAAYKIQFRGTLAFPHPEDVGLAVR